MLFVEFQWDVALLVVGADAAPVGGSQLAAPVGSSQLRSLAARASVHPGGGENAYLSPPPPPPPPPPRVDEEVASRLIMNPKHREEEFCYGRDTGLDCLVLVFGQGRTN